MPEVGGRQRAGASPGVPLLVTVARPGFLPGQGMPWSWVSSFQQRRDFFQQSGVGGVGGWEGFVVVEKC